MTSQSIHCLQFELACANKTPAQMSRITQEILRQIQKNAKARSLTKAQTLEKLRTWPLQPEMGNVLADLHVQEGNTPVVLKDNKFSVQAAGCLIVAADTGRVLIGQRSKLEKNFPLHWACAGGGIEDGETPMQAALREAQEETGLNLSAIAGKFRVQKLAYTDRIRTLGLAVNSKTDPSPRLVSYVRAFHNFVLVVPEEFEARTSSEHEGWRWVAWPPATFRVSLQVAASAQGDAQRLHPGFERLLRHAASCRQVELLVGGDVFERIAQDSDWTTLGFPAVDFATTRDTVGASPAFGYHATDAANLESIANAGLLTFEPFIGQNSWIPATEARNFFAADPKTCLRFLDSRARSSALLRVPKLAHSLQREASGELFSRETVAPANIELLTGLGWMRIG